LIDDLTLNKVLPALLLPTCLTLWLCAYGAWRRKRWPVFLGIGVLAVAGCPVVANGLLMTLEDRYRDAGRGLDQLDAVYVLGGYSESYQTEELEPQWNEAGDRLELGLRMVLEGRAGVLVLSAGGAEGILTEGARAKAIALRRGLREEQVVVTSAVNNTADEAQRIAALMGERGWRRVALVTSAFHMRRALMQMAVAGVDLMPAPTDFHAVEGGWRLQDLVPQGDALRWSEKALREWIGMGFYWVKGASGRMS
jgi:uncharacterized SAM-binding protein YcdF (DUF218 family)